MSDPPARRGRKSEVKPRDLSPDIAFLRKTSHSGGQGKGKTKKTFANVTPAVKKRRIQSSLDSFVEARRKLPQEQQAEESGGHEEQVSNNAAQGVSVSLADKSAENEPDDNNEGSQIPDAGSSEDNRDCQQEPDETLEKLPLFKIPTYLHKFFRYEGHVMKNGISQKFLVMTCVYCEDDPEMEGKNMRHRGAPWSNFHRHLNMKHPELYEAEQESGNVSRGISKVVPKTTVTVYAPEPDILSFTKWKKPNNKNAFKFSHPAQKKFMKDVMDLVALEQFPLDIMQRAMFVKLVRHLNPFIRIFSRRTLSRRFRKSYLQDFIPFIRKELKEAPESSCHVILDLWTDRQKSSILGVKLQFISAAWKLRNVTVAFRHFEGGHSSIKIRGALDDILEHTLKLTPAQIGFAVGDSASNMKKAFVEKQITEPAGEDNTDDIECDDDDEDQWVDIETIFEEEDEEPEDVIDVAEMEASSRQLEICDWKNKDIKKFPCFCHILQLIIKDAVCQCDATSAMEARIKAVVAFFHRSNSWYDELKKKAGKAIVNQGATRWSSLFFVLDRLTEPKVQDALNDVLQATRKSKNACRESFSLEDFELMNGMKRLISHIVEATNDLQADKVTSSEILPTIAGAYEEIQKEIVGESEALQGFKRTLLQCFEERFSTGALEREENEDRLVRLRRITRHEIFADEDIILAACLDPRVKLTPFLDAETDELNRNYCTAEKATTILLESVRRLQPSTVPEEPPAVVVATDKPRTLLSKYLTKRCVQVSPTVRASETEEVLKYLGEKNEKPKSDPLVFWETNSHKYPKLSSLARVYLAIPASSGSVERLFSVSGALQRFRRNKLSWRSTEDLLCYRELRKFQLFGPRMKPEVEDEQTSALVK